MNKGISITFTLHEIANFTFAIALLVAFIDFLAGLVGRTLTGMSWWEGVALLIIFYMLTRVTEDDDRRR